MNQIELYPLKFKSIVLDKIWGGDKLATILKKGNSKVAGESWELSGVAGKVSIVEEGPLKDERLDSLIKTYGSQLLGTDFQGQEEFPLLIKFLDAQDDLSIQVHPNDDLASKRGEGRGKTEMWYILDADENAVLMNGFNQEMSVEQVKSSIKEGRILDYINQVPVRKDDAFFIPAGRVHSIGKGILLAEIQQTSDTTYRLYDFERKDDDGNKRELHVEQSIEAIDYTALHQAQVKYNKELHDAPVNLVDSPYFKTDRLVLTKSVEYNYSSATCRIVIATAGNGLLSYKGATYTLHTGDVYLLPAALESIELIPTTHSLNLLLVQPNS